MKNPWILKIAEDVEDLMPQPEKEFVQAMMDIVERHGKLADNDGKGIWTGYVSPEENDNASRGIRCGNCAHYEGEGVCHLLVREVEEYALCRLAAIPDFIVQIDDMMS